MPAVFKAPHNSGQLIGGVVHFEADVLTIEIERHRLLRPPKAERVDIPLQDIDYATFKRRALGGGLLDVRVLYADALASLPWADRLNVQLVFTRREFRHAEQIATDLAQAIGRETAESSEPTAETATPAATDPASDATISEQGGETNEDRR